VNGRWVAHHQTLRCWWNIRCEDVAVRIPRDVEIEVRRAERREWRAVRLAGTPGVPGGTIWLLPG